jgi:DNA-binding NtrC family response regulator
MIGRGELICVVGDDASVREAVGILVLSAGFRVETFASAHEFLATARAEVPSCLVLDVNLPEMSGLDLQQELAKSDNPMPIIFLTGQSDIPSAVQAINAGAWKFLTKPFDCKDLLDAIRQEIASCPASWQPGRDLARHTSAQEELYTEEEIRASEDFEGIVGQSSALRQVLQLVETVATSDSTVLLLGETGTGKELVAQAIHDRSRRKKRTSVKLNCAAIPTGLLESEFFGHERGAFTGAIAQKIGRLELADQGTLFLDEVGDIPLELQPKLLRVLQDGEFERLGSTRTKKVDVRLVAATNRDLERMIEERQFRSDLYYRLNVFPIRIPPLRERPEDIPMLVRYFCRKYARRMEKSIETIPAEAMRKLARWHWPGNVRELQNLVERAVILTRSSTLAISEPEFANRGVNLAPARAVSFDEQDRIVRMLKETKGRVGGPRGAAARLGLKRTTLLNRMKKMCIDPRKTWEIRNSEHSGSKQTLRKEP